ncbi:unnamed protein product [Schistosoma turkestanicum]|nr:unnamed protein product [Schistosoma turkestanicum]
MHRIYRIDLNATKDDEAEKCFEIVLKGANLCIEKGLFTLDEMEPYLESDIERYSKLLKKCPDLAKCSILIERHIQGINSIRSANNLKDVYNATKNIKNKEILFDNFVEFTELTNSSETKQIIPDQKSMLKCFDVIDTLEKRLFKEQIIKLTVPIHVLNYFTDLSSKSTDIYAKLDAEKLLLTKVRLQMKQFNKSRHDKPITLNDMTWIDYLVVFVDQIIKLLKKCIANLFGETNFNKELQLSNENEAESHYNLLMYSTEELSVHLHHHRYITENIDQIDSNKNEKYPSWNDKIMLETRSRETNIIKNYLTGNSKLPGLIYGPAGCGKSSLLRWTVYYFEHIHSKSETDIQLTSNSTQLTNTLSTSQTKIEPIIIVCCVSRTCLSTSLQSVLVQIIEQLAMKFSLQHQHIKSLCEYAEAVRLLNTMFNYANSLKPILIIIDNIEYLYPDEHVQMFHWLSYELPNPYVRLLMTTSSEKIVKGFNKRFGEGCCISLSACYQTQYVMNEILPKLIKSNLKALDEEQISKNFALTSTDQDLINLALQKNITPNYIQLLADIFTVKLTTDKANFMSIDNLPTDLSSLFVIRLQQIHSMLKQKGLFSVALLRFMPYIACSRFGLTFLELIEILQNDSDVLQARIQLNQIHSIKHFPIGCLQHLIYSPIYDLKKYLMFTKTDNRLLITFTSESFRKGVLKFWGFNMNDSNYALKEEEIDDFSTNENNVDFDKNQMDTIPKEFTFHRYLSDYWLGINRGQDDGGGEQQPKSTGHSYELKTNSSAVEQNEDLFNTVYYWLAMEKSIKSNSGIVTGTYDKRYICNARRLTELPYQLLQLGSDSVQELLKHVIFSFDFLLGKLLLGLRPNDVITELYYLRQLNQLRTNDEIMYLLNLLRSLSTKLSIVPTLLNVELAGRIGHLIGTEYVNLGRQLLNSIDCDSNKVNCLLPLLSICYNPPLQPELLNVKYKNNETRFFSSTNQIQQLQQPQQQEMKEIITISSDLRFLFTLTLNPINNFDHDESNVNSNEVIINMWEVNSLTKSCSLSLGVWSNYAFHQAHMPIHQNQLVLLTYSTNAVLDNKKFGILTVNLELGCVEGNLSVNLPSQLKILCITRSSVLITQCEPKGNNGKYTVSQDYATVYSIPNLKPITGVLSKVPLPFYLSPTDRIYFGPSRWPIQVKTSIEKKRKSQHSTNELKDINSNSVQIRLKNALNDVAAWIKCPLAPATFQANIRGENLLIGCKSLGQIYRFDLTLVSRCDY